jgi:hypothetical protein
MYKKRWIQRGNKHLKEFKENTNKCKENSVGYEREI